jgi:hypothetical protein
MVQSQSDARKMRARLQPNVITNLKIDILKATNAAQVNPSDNIKAAFTNNE